MQRLVVKTEGMQWKSERSETQPVRRAVAGLSDEFLKQPAKLDGMNQIRICNNITNEKGKPVEGA